MSTGSVVLVIIGALILVFGLIPFLIFACDACSWSAAEAESAREASGTGTMQTGLITHQYGRALPAGVVGLTADKSDCEGNKKMRTFDSIVAEAPGLLTMSEYTVIRCMYTYAPSSLSGAWCANITLLIFSVALAVRPV